MVDDDQFGPWIEHDGRGCPVPAGTVVRVQWNDGDFYVDTVTSDLISPPTGMTSCWHWASWHPLKFIEYAYVARYSVKKPRGLTILENLIADLPETVDA